MKIEALDPKTGNSTDVINTQIPDVTKAQILNVIKAQIPNEKSHNSTIFGAMGSCFSGTLKGVGKCLYGAATGTGRFFKSFTEYTLDAATLSAIACYYAIDNISNGEYTLIVPAQVTLSVLSLVYPLIYLKYATEKGKRFDNPKKSESGERHNTIIKAMPLGSRTVKGFTAASVVFTVITLAEKEGNEENLTAQQLSPSMLMLTILGASVVTEILLTLLRRKLNLSPSWLAYSGQLLEEEESKVNWKRVLTGNGNHYEQLLRGTELRWEIRQEESLLIKFLKTFSQVGPMASVGGIFVFNLSESQRTAFLAATRLGLLLPSAILATLALINGYLNIFNKFPKVSYYLSLALRALNTFAYTFLCEVVLVHLPIAFAINGYPVTRRNPLSPLASDLTLGILGPSSLYAAGMDFLKAASWKRKIPVDFINGLLELEANIPLAELPLLEKYFAEHLTKFGVEQLNAARAARAKRPETPRRASIHELLPANITRPDSPVQQAVLGSTNHIDPHALPPVNPLALPTGATEQAAPVQQSVLVNIELPLPSSTTGPNDSAPDQQAVVVLVDGEPRSPTEPHVSVPMLHTGANEEKVASQPTSPVTPVKLNLPGATLSQPGSPAMFALPRDRAQSAVSPHSASPLLTPLQRSGSVSSAPGSATPPTPPGRRVTPPTPPEQTGVNPPPPPPTLVRTLSLGS